MNTVLVGAQWGDEGKGKVIDFLTEESDVVVRFQGGSNAGHTVVVGDKKYVLHLVPSGILHNGKHCVIGNGAVMDPFDLMKELEQVESWGFELKVKTQRDVFEPVAAEVELTAGVHTIRLANASAAMPDIDVLRLR